MTGDTDKMLEVLKDYLSTELHAESLTEEEAAEFVLWVRREIKSLSGRGKLRQSVTVIIDPRRRG